MKKVYVRLLFLTFLIFCVAHYTSAQTVRTVCASGCNFTTIQAAATAAVSGDTILINVNGAHTEKNIALPEKSLVFKGLGKTTTFLQSAASRANASGGRIFSYAAPAGAGSNTFTFLDMTIRYAYAPLTDVGGGLFQSAGGVFYATGILKGLRIVTNNVRFYANETTGGNQINSGGACFYISASGTGFTYNADLSITNCDFDDNRVANSAGTSLSDGPCFNLLGSPARIVIDNCTFTSNNGYTRGGVIYSGSNWEFKIRNSLFNGNTCRNGDGGCFGGRSGLSWTIENCLFSNNSAVFVSSVNGNNGWGGVFLGKGAKFRNCTFYNNTAVKGGAICRTNNGISEEMQIINCTFYGNGASSTGRAIHYGSSASVSSFPLTMVNTIITNGSGAAASDIHFVLPYSQFSNNIKNYCNAISTEHVSPGTTPVFEFNSGNSTLNISSTLASNGGPTNTLALSAGSSMINAGTFTSGVGYDIPIKDQRNYSRTDGGIDIGAFEYDGITDNSSVPVITFTNPGNTVQTTNRVITATITDVNGVYWYPQSTDLRPRIYFRKNAGAWSSAAGVLNSGNGVNGSWNFTISSAAMGGLTLGDSVKFFVVAQDVSSAPSIASSPTGVNATSVNNMISVPAASAYLIGAASLPVTLEKFTATPQNRSANISWWVGQESNVSHYEIERSTDAVNWVTAAKVTAANRRQYTASDDNLNDNIYFYRLRSVDNDGKFSLSKIVQVKIGSVKSVQVYPNPSTGGYIIIECAKPTQVRLYTNSGIMLWEKNLPTGATRIETLQLTPGMYRIVSEGKTHSLVIQ